MSRPGLPRPPWFRHWVRAKAAALERAHREANHAREVSGGENPGQMSLLRPEVDPESIADILREGPDLRMRGQ